MLRVGVDVGGTNTDAVILDGRNVIATIKVPTSTDVTSGVTQALEQLLSRSGIEPTAISAVMIGTTHFLNAVIQRIDLTPVAAVRICLPATASLPPAVDWPEDIRSLICARTYMVAGGYEHDGRKIAALDEKKLETIARELVALGIKAVAISCVFAPINADMEKRAAEIFCSIDPDLRISTSSTIGGMGLLARESATILNASLTNISVKITNSFRSALTSLGINAPFFFSQNDGTLMNVETAERFPVLTFASGPTNSMRGAAFLSSLDDAIVVDIGGTTTDVGALSSGFPRLASGSIDVGGVRTNFRMPDVHSIGLGGGSIVKKQTGIKIGPESVGYQLIEQGVIFGGTTLTASDIAVAAGLADMGSPDRVKDIESGFVSNAIRIMQYMIEDAVDVMKISVDDVPVILVGGGSVLVKEEIKGASRVVRPKHFDVANAIGAAISKVGGECERVFSYAEVGREAAMQFAKDEAVQAAIAAGADAESIHISEFDEVPLAYMTDGATRLKVKAIGDIKGL